MIFWVVLKVEIRHRVMMVERSKNSLGNILGH
jgi:hypothetical protein